MATHPAVRGACACGRNRYVATLPANECRVMMDNTSSTRRHQAAPLAAWLRIPLVHLRSATYARFPDETHNAIRRVFESPSRRADKRVFCGYCGTPLSRWQEHPPAEADFISLTLGSVLDEDLERLAELGLLPREDDEDDEEAGVAEDEDEDEDDGEDGDEDEADAREGDGGEAPMRVVLPRRARGVVRGAPWFEEMIEHSALGRVKRRKGGHTARDGSAMVQWEVVEFSTRDDSGDSGDEPPAHNSDTPSKRKLSEVDPDGGDGDGDVHMQS